MLNAKKCSNLAEREGFEPSVPVTQYARLAIWCLRPLGHLSARRKYSGGPKLCGYIECVLPLYHGRAYRPMSRQIDGTSLDRTVSQIDRVQNGHSRHHIQPRRVTKMTARPPRYLY